MLHAPLEVCHSLKCLRGDLGVLEEKASLLLRVLKSYEAESRGVGKEVGLAVEE